MRADPPATNPAQPSTVRPTAGGLLNRRRSGILLHVSSLPGSHGIGDFGQSAYDFVDFLERTGQTIWQVLPLGPTGYGNSPYQLFSSHAGNPWFINLPLLAEEGLLTRDDLSTSPAFPAGRVDFEAIATWHNAVTRRAYASFQAQPKHVLRADFEKFLAAEAAWLDDYSLFIALKSERPEAMWTVWPTAVRARQPAALAAIRERLEDEILYQQFIQFMFRRQWLNLKRYANDRGVLIMGDVPIFVSQDSVDVWANQALFWLNPDGSPAYVAGVPPDYFSATGQRWGNPLYRWDRLAEQDYGWWIERMAAALRALDLVRIDHFRGFEAYWEIPADSPSAERGRWAPGPGEALFRALAARCGNLPIVAEDLGVITPAVEELRDRLNLPGMRVLQFAFGNDAKARDYRPHNHIRNCVVYTGTHDNDTAVGWFASRAHQGTTRDAAEILEEQDYALRYLHSDGQEIHWDMIRAAWASVANTAIAPLQDLLGLGTAARLNLPGTAVGNWSWRLQPDMLTPQIERRLAELTNVYERR